MKQSDQGLYLLNAFYMCRILTDPDAYSAHHRHYTFCMTGLTFVHKHALAHYMYIYPKYLDTLTPVLLNPDIPSFTNSVDPDQLASEEAN